MTVKSNMPPAAVTMICPNLACRRTVVAPESARGKVVRCAHCNQPFRVPSGGSSTTEGEARAEMKRRSIGA